MVSFKLEACRATVLRSWIVLEIIMLNMTSCCWGYIMLKYDQLLLRLCYMWSVAVKAIQCYTRPDAVEAIQCYYMTSCCWRCIMLYATSCCWGYMILFLRRCRDYTLWPRVAMGTANLWPRVSVGTANLWPRVSAGTANVWPRLVVVTAFLLPCVSFRPLIVTSSFCRGH